MLHIGAYFSDGGGFVQTPPVLASERGDDSCRKPAIWPIHFPHIYLPGQHQLLLHPLPPHHVNHFPLAYRSAAILICSLLNAPIVQVYQSSSKVVIASRQT